MGEVGELEYCVCKENVCVKLRGVGWWGGGGGVDGEE